MSFTLKGIEGKARIEAIMAKLRSMPPIEKECVRMDYLEGIDGLPVSDVLKFILEDGWIAVRPSGTEPKIKFYLAADGESEAMCEKRLAELSAFVTRVTNL